MKGSVQLIAGILCGWLVANLVDGMRPSAWLELIDEQATKLSDGFTASIKDIIREEDYE